MYRNIQLHNQFFASIQGGTQKEEQEQKKDKLLGDVLEVYLFHILSPKTYNFQE